MKWVLAVLLVVLSTGLRWLLDPWLGPGVPFLSYIPAVVLAATAGGLGPGLLAIVLSALAGNYLFEVPHYTLLISNQRSFVELLLFLFAGGTITLLADWRRASLRALATVNAALEERVQRRTNALRERTERLEAVAWKVAHELNTPLPALDGMAEALREALERGDRAGAAHALERIHHNVAVIASLAQELEEMTTAAADKRVDRRGP